jgi:arsenate reductase
MAEAYARRSAGDLFEAFSAGIEPRELNPVAVLALDEVEIDMPSHYCKNVEEYVAFHFRFVIMLRERARDVRPIFHSAEHF